MWWRQTEEIRLCQRQPKSKVIAPRCLCDNTQKRSGEWEAATIQPPRDMTPARTPFHQERNNPATAIHRYKTDTPLKGQRGKRKDPTESPQPHWKGGRSPARPKSRKSLPPDCNRSNPGRWAEPNRHKKPIARLITIARGIRANVAY